LNITQPLLNGAGKTYQQPLDRACPDRHPDRARQSLKDLQSVLLEVYQTYWDLHLQRALLLQKRDLYDRGVEICRKLEGRRR